MKSQWDIDIFCMLHIYAIHTRIYFYSTANQCVCMTFIEIPTTTTKKLFDVLNYFNNNK